MTIPKWRVAIGSMFVVFFLLVLISENIPESETETKLDWIDKATLATGLEQGWGVFAPIPASLEVQTFALVTLDNGEQIRWEPPSGNLITGTARFERWRKWSTRVRTVENEHNWAVNASRIASDVGENTDAKPVLVQLHRRWSEALPPGEGFERTYSEFLFYEYDPITGEGTKPDTGSGNGVVLDLDAELPPLEDLPGMATRASIGELPGPNDPPAPKPERAQRDPAASTTQQIDPIDKALPGQIVVGLDDELPPLDQLAFRIEEESNE